MFPLECSLVFLRSLHRSFLCRAAVTTARLIFSHQCPEAQRPTGVAHSVAQARKRWTLLCCFIWTRPVWTLSFLPFCLDATWLFQCAHA
jgi:hypothetical protein